MARTSPLPNRQSIRLKGYDYSQNGAYFVALVAQHREMIFGCINNSTMVPNPLGQVVADC